MNRDAKANRDLHKPEHGGRSSGNGEVPLADAPRIKVKALPSLSHPATAREVAPVSPSADEATRTEASVSSACQGTSDQPDTFTPPMQPEFLSPTPTQDSHRAAAAYTDAARRVLLTDAGVQDFGESNAELFGATTPLEKMLVDQMTVCHNSAMRLAARASTIGKVPEMGRLMNLSLRCMTVFQEAALTLDRIRRQGQQTITIQHVTVQGQAVIAGNIDRGSR